MKSYQQLSILTRVMRDPAQSLSSECRHGLKNQSFSVAEPESKNNCIKTLTIRISSIESSTLFYSNILKYGMVLSKLSCKSYNSEHNMWWRDNET